MASLNLAQIYSRTTLEQGNMTSVNEFYFLLNNLELSLIKATYKDLGMIKLLTILFSLSTFTFCFGQMSIDTGRGGTSSGGRAQVIQDKKSTPVKAKRFNLFILGDEYSDANSLIQVIQYMGVQHRVPFEIAPSKITPQNCSLEMHLLLFALSVFLLLLFIVL